MLERFYEAFRQGKADFINGNRLVYPMENEAMRFLNWLANVFFAKSLVWFSMYRSATALRNEAFCAS